MCLYMAQSAPRSSAHNDLTGQKSDQNNKEKNNRPDSQPPGGDCGTMAPLDDALEINLSDALSPPFASTEEDH